MMYEHLLTVGLYDKDTEAQEIDGNTAKNMLADILIREYGVYAFTMMDCIGVYRMESTGHIIQEPSIRIEIAAENLMEEETALKMIGRIKEVFNQESIMYKAGQADIRFY